tara:strand:+ start:187 stop:477 length:291 start_codon:yes stop_codon:yes gene_type:complete
MRHKHADVIIAWANGAQIQTYVNKMGGWMWVDICEPMWWVEDSRYRVKPEPKPDVEFRYTVNSRFLLQGCDSWEKPNLKLAFDGETGELKSAEVLK